MVATALVVSAVMVRTGAVRSTVSDKVWVGRVSELVVDLFEDGDA
jgi:hypothetical protein